MRRGVWGRASILSVTPNAAPDTGLQSQIPWGILVPCWMPRLGNLLWDLELFAAVQKLFDIIVLQFVGHLLCSSIVGLMATSYNRIYATCYVSQICCSQSPCPRGRPLLAHASAGDTLTLKAGLAQSLVEDHCSFLWVLCTQGFVCTISGGYEVLF